MNSTPFLKDIAALLLTPGNHDMSGICVVFPNKRARLYLSKYLGELTEKPVWAPRYLTINELMENLSGYIYADRLTLLFELFGAFKKATGSNESFDNFYTYSETLLADFDEIDKYLADARDLYGNLAGLKSIDGRFNYLSEDQVAAIRRFWNTFDPENVSDGQKTFLSLWEALPEIYSGLRTSLSEKGLAYEGMAYRKVAEELSGNGKLKGLNFQRYFFVGFNALNRCEERLFRYLKNAGKAEFFWDYDTWYTSDEMHEAGSFIRKNVKEFPENTTLDHENLIRENKNIFFLPVSSNSGQAAALPYIFNRLGLTDEGQAEHTALVLADENLLVPVLYSIPAEFREINITMGYPLSGSAVFNLIDSLYELIKNQRQLEHGTGFYFKDVLSVMGNPLLKTLYGKKLQQIRREIIDRNLVYLTVKDVLDENSKDILFGKFPGNTCQYLLQVTDYLIGHLPGDEDNMAISGPVQSEILYQVHKFLTRLQDTLTVYGYSPGDAVLFTLIRKMLRLIHIPFSGEPLAGLQVLGILETRTLDFDNVIVLSMNEGILPRAAASGSFIPYSLRYGFGLPGPEHSDSIYAYYFYRLIQRAKNVVLVYDCSSGGLRTGERSRYMHQLYYEMPDAVKEITPSTVISQIPVKQIVIEKKGDVAEALAGYIENEDRYLSPSAINEFLNCPLRFYFHHIAGLPQPDEVSEDIDARIFGNLLHKGMNKLYSDFGTTPVTPVELEALLKNEDAIDKALDEAFSEILFREEPGKRSRKAEGFNLIVRQVLKTYMQNLIRADSEAGSFSIISLEKRYAIPLPVSVNGRNIRIFAGGKIDRIDRVEGKTRIIDYKTGTVKNSFASVESLFDPGEKQRNDAAFQVLLYSMIYDKHHPGQRIVPGLYYIRESHKDTFSSRLLYGAKKDVLDSYEAVAEKFEELLQHYLTMLFDTREPFVQTDNLEICGYCAYAGICRR
ncbi:MAG TPA: PD-(D/E)XK nuclease family protein [Bacteroidales bacterium]|nr:PD-(D/E)XK nuclease family protein [Bacteroidales bacterium]